MDTNVDLLQWFTIFFIKSGANTSGGAIKYKIMLNQQLLELPRPKITKFKKLKVSSSFTDNIWSADLADMQLITKYSQGILFFIMCYWYAWIVPLNDKKKGIIITNASQKMLGNSRRKPNKIAQIKAVNFTIDQWNHIYKSKV